MGAQNIKFLFNYIVLYDCRIYSYIKNRLRLDKLELRIYIGYLVKYDFTNIFRIWLLNFKRVIFIRNIVFDIIKRYNSNDNPFQATKKVIEIIQIFTLNVEKELDN